MSQSPRMNHIRIPSRGYDLAVVAVPAVVLCTVASSSPGTPALVVLSAVLTIFVASWFAFGRRAMDGGPGWPLFLALVLAVSAIGAMVSPAFAVFQALAYPLAWSLPHRLRSALVANVLVTLAIGIGYAIGTSLVEALAVEGISLAFSLSMGAWISKIEERSEGRQALLDELTAAQTQLAALHRDAGALAERERLARELHDTLTQSLTGIVMLAERAKTRHQSDPALTVLEDAARQAMTEARGLITATARVHLDGGLADALHTLADRFHRETGLQVFVEVSVDVPRGLEVVLLRCAQEGLANVRKHASARTAKVRVTPAGDDVMLTVTDDGRGPGTGTGFGLIGMNDRLALVGGSATLEIHDEGGAVLTVCVPLPTVVTA